MPKLYNRKNVCLNNAFNSRNPLQNLFPSKDKTKHEFHKNIRYSTHYLFPSHNAYSKLLSSKSKPYFNALKAY